VEVPLFCFFLPWIKLSYKTSSALQACHKAIQAEETWHEKCRTTPANKGTGQYLACSQPSLLTAMSG